MSASASLYTYSAFALTIASEIPLPELRATNAPPDVIVRIGSAHPAPLHSEQWQVLAGPYEVRGRAPAVGAFQVSGGKQILINPVANADERAVRLAILGPLLGVVLSQRGKFVLHASTVAVAEHAVAFSGCSGAGKSTLAAAMLRQGHRLIADDITVIDMSGDVPLVQPGFPRVKLWPDSAAELADEAHALPLLHPDCRKLSLPTPQAFETKPLPLARCYLLEEGSGVSIVELSSSAAVLSLVRCTYQAGWMHETAALGPNLLQCTALVRSGVVRELRRPRSFDALPRLIADIREDVDSRMQCEPSLYALAAASRMHS